MTTRPVKKKEQQPDDGPERSADERLLARRAEQVLDGHAVAVRLVVFASERLDHADCGEGFLGNRRRLGDPVLDGAGITPDDSTEVAREQRHEWDRGEHHERKPPVEDQHQRHRADEREGLRNELAQVVRHRRLELADVARQPRRDLADAAPGVEPAARAGAGACTLDAADPR